MNNNQIGKRITKIYDKNVWRIMSYSIMGNSTSHYISQLKKDLIKEGYEPIQISITIEVIGEHPKQGNN